MAGGSLLEQMLEAALRNGGLRGGNGLGMKARTPWESAFLFEMGRITNLVVRRRR